MWLRRRDGWRNRAKTLGNLLASERAVEYVAILRAFVKFREGHEPEPLHEDLAHEVCGEDAAPDAESLFKGDIRQLKEWELVTERIEKERLADATGFYAPDGRLVSLMSRVGDLARRVWGKLNAKLRELERRNHRLEDLGARLGDLSAWPEESVLHAWLRGLLATAAMRGDAQIRPDGERSRLPLPKIAERAKRTRIVTWITPRKVGAKADVASIEQARGERLKNWMRQVGVFPSAGKAVRLGGGRYASFADCRGIVDVITATRLGGGQRAMRHLEIVGTPCAETIQVSVAEGELSFQDLELTEMT